MEREVKEEVQKKVKDEVKTEVKDKVKKEVKQKVEQEVKKAVKKEVKEASKDQTDKHPVFLSKKTLSQRAADWLAKWAGSWAFISIFVVVLIFWMLLNAYFWFKYSFSGEPFDPYPFILLNLILSTLAAIQAPIILMSQNRSNQLDRIRSEYDYSVNRKAEREIRQLQMDISSIKRLLKKKK